jgi:hypothetical protein
MAGAIHPANVTHIPPQVAATESGVVCAIPEVERLGFPHGERAR